jgi:hypothetical protein
MNSAMKCLFLVIPDLIRNPVTFSFGFTTTSLDTGFRRYDINATFG